MVRLRLRLRLRFRLRLGLWKQPPDRMRGGIIAQIIPLEATHDCRQALEVGL